MSGRTFARALCVAVLCFTLVGVERASAIQTDPAEDVYAFGDAPFFGSTGNIALAAPLVGMAPTPSGNGYWLLSRDGGVFSYGAAQFFGSTGGIRLNRPVVGMASTPSGNGYWLVASDGGIFAFGDARFFGSTGAIRLNQPVVGMASTPSGNGYWLVASDGGIFAFGDARFFGSTGAIRLNQPVVGMASTPSGNGYWLVASDGGIFAFGDARFFGSTGAIRLNQPVVGMASTPSGNGYWLVASDGGIFAFGNAGFFGSKGGQSLSGKRVVGISATPSGLGYWMVDTGIAPPPPPPPPPAPAPTPSPPAPAPSPSGANCTGGVTIGEGAARSFFEPDGSEYLIHNNNWNDTAGGNSVITACNYNNWYVISNTPNHSDLSVQTYPNVHRDYNDAPLSSITSARFAATGPHCAGCIWNIAFDIWIGDGFSHELMIWTENWGQRPAGNQVGTTTIGGHEYQVWRSGSGDRGIITYLSVVPQRSGTMPLSLFFADVRARGWTPTTTWQVDFGVEIVDTNGNPERFDFTDFYINDVP